MQRSLNQVVDELRVWAAAHVQVNDMAYGSIADIYNTNEITHCILAVNCNNAVVGDNYVDLTMEIAVFDVVNPPTVEQQNRPQHEVESDTLQIINDLYQTIDNADRWKDWCNIEQAGNAQKFVDRSSDAVTGWLLNLTLRVQVVQGICDLPLISYDYEGEYSPICAPVRIFENGVLVATIPSGGSYSYTSGGSCLPATWTLINTDGTTLSTGEIASGASGNITAPNAEVVVQTYTGTAIETVQIPSGVTDTILIPDCCCIFFDIVVSEGGIVGVNQTYRPDTQVISTETIFTAPNGYVIQWATEGGQTGWFIYESLGSSRVYYLNSNPDLPIGNWSVAGTGIEPTPTSGAVCVSPVVSINGDEIYDNDCGNIEIDVVNKATPSVAVGTWISGTQQLVIPDVRIQARDTAGNNLGPVAAFSPTNAEPITPVVMPDTDVEINGTVEGSVLAGQVPNVQLTDSAANIITPTGVVQSGNDFTATLPDVPVEVNGISEGNVRPATIDIVISDGVSPVVPDSVTIVGQDVQIVVPSGGGTSVIGSMVYKTGNEAFEFPGANDYTAGLNFHQLSINNPYGNNYRFATSIGYTDGTDYFLHDGTLSDKATVCPNDLIADFSQYNEVAGRVFQIYLPLQSTDNYANATTAINALTVAGLGSFFIPTFEQICRIEKLCNTDAPYELEPFAFGTLAYQFWTSTQGDTGRRHCGRNQQNSPFNINVLETTSTVRRIPCRWATLAEV